MTRCCRHTAVLIGLSLWVAFFSRLCLAQSSEPSADNFTRTLTLGSYYSRGDYGETADTRIRYMPVSFQQQLDNWILQVTTPHLELDGLGNALVNVGGVTRATRSAQNITSSGLGDTVTSATYQFESLFAQALFVDLVLEAKIPTADENKGLGTGEYDYSMRVDFSRPLDQAVLFGSIGYRYRGKSELFVGLSNSASVQLGLQRPFSANTSIGIIYDYSEPASDFSKEIHELLPFINWGLTENWSILTYGAWGFTEDSPDFALGAQLSYRW